MNYTEKLLEVRDLHKAYARGDIPTKALNGITFDVLSGEFLGIMGASGSGKTTLLNCIATIIKPTSGQILLSGTNISAFGGNELAMYRGSKIGYLFQDFALLDNLTGKENILLPLSIHNADARLSAALWRDGEKTKCRNSQWQLFYLASWGYITSCYILDCLGIFFCSRRSNAFGCGVIWYCRNTSFYSWTVQIIKSVCQFCEK
ncbi:ABC transporter ATP-binding protein [Clostridium oryzae]|uniref:ABC transporter ATP-binding protein YxdL n=1 Tax=Clostridium oryzae TaxID=1450648 RepID=A0A1V4IXJ0_9CLOT|nr:ABC transporter ATP-binding protein [Clostridium oryzae]OPJ64782.1 ABC transporter ATP-binding protein YxdL [Clostridium oryzae]